MNLPKTIRQEQACELLGFFGKCRKRKLKDLIKKGAIKKFAKDRGFVFDLEEILEVREKRFNGQV